MLKQIKSEVGYFVKKADLEEMETEIRVLRKGILDAAKLMDVKHPDNMKAYLVLQQLLDSPSAVC